MFDFLSDCLKKEYMVVGTLREDGEKTLIKVRHNRTGEYFFVRRFKGDPEVYRKLLSIKSRYLPEILEVATDGEEILVMEEYITGDNLQELMKGIRFSEKETKKIATDTCKALYVLHREGIVHRDVKPANIMIRQGSNDAVLLDFDASRTIKDDRDQDTVQLGTTGYAAPEQYGISQTDGRADIYALGVMINLMLTGVHPSEQLAKGKLGRIVSKCTMVHPDKRYKDVIRLMEALGA